MPPSVRDNFFCETEIVLGFEEPLRIGISGNVMAPNYVATRVDRQSSGRKQPVPSPSAAPPGSLFVQSVGHPNTGRFSLSVQVEETLNLAKMVFQVLLDSPRHHQDPIFLAFRVVDLDRVVSKVEVFYS